MVHVRDLNSQLGPLFVENLEKALFSPQYDLIAYHTLSTSNQMPSRLCVIDTLKNEIIHTHQVDATNPIMTFNPTGRFLA